MRFAPLFFLLASTLFAQVRAPLKPVSSDCSADGTVVNKISGERVPRALVVMNGQTGQISSVADNAGHFTFTNIACGAFLLMAERVGFLSGISGSPRVTLAFPSAGSSLHDLKAEITPQAVVTGRVLDEQGDPEQNVQITAMLSRVVQGRRTFQPTNVLQTNDLGEFRLASLAAGRYIVCARGGGSVRFQALGPSAATVAADSCYPGPLEGGLSSSMALTSGMETRVDFTIRKVPAMHVSGTVTGLPKNNGIGIHLLRRGVDSSNSPVGQPGNIQPDGRFQISLVPSGSYILSTDYWEVGKRLVARVPVEVGSSDIDNITVHLEQAFSVTGTVRYQTKPGSNFVPAQLNLISADGSAGGGAVQWNKDHTAFTISEVPPGVYRLASAQPVGFHVKSAILGGRDISREDISITQAAGPIDVIVSDEGGSLAGQVTDANDQPVSGWVMVLGDSQPRNVMTDATGSFKVSGLAPGDYKAYAWDDVQPVEYANPDWMRSYSGAAVTIVADQSTQVKLRQQSPAP